MAKLSTYVSYACGFINFDIKKHDDLPMLIERFTEFCESYKQITEYYLIAHYETDVPHIHFIFFCSQHVMLITLFNKLRTCFVPDYTRDENGITISRCENINSHMRYIVHQDKESIKLGKKMYDSSCIVSNQDNQVIENYIHSKKGQVDAYLLRDVVLDSKHDFEIMVKLTLPLYHRYRYEIQSIKDERVYLDALRKKEIEDASEYELPF